MKLSLSEVKRPLQTRRQAVVNSCAVNGRPLGAPTVGNGTMVPATSRKTSVLENMVVSTFATLDIWLGQLGLSILPLNIVITEQLHSFLS